MIPTYESVKTFLKNYRMYKLILCTKPSELIISDSEQLAYFTMFNNSLQILKKLPKNGHIYYQILYHCYLSPEEHYSTYEIIDALNEDGIFMSLRSFYRKKKLAIELICTILSS